MGSSTFTRHASCLPVLACMCAVACQPADEFDDDDIDIAALRDADADGLLLACSEATGPIDLLVDPDGIVWLDGERQLGHEQLVVAVGDAMSVTLCMEFAEPGDLARVSAHDGAEQVLGGDGGQVSCVVMLRPFVIDSTGRRLTGALELDIDPFQPVPTPDDGFKVFYLAPVKSSGKVKIVGSCPKFDVDDP